MGFFFFSLRIAVFVDVVQGWGMVQVGTDIRQATSNISHCWPPFPSLSSWILYSGQNLLQEYTQIVIVRDSWRWCLYFPTQCHRIVFWLDFPSWLDIFLDILSEEVFKFHSVISVGTMLCIPTGLSKFLWYGSEDEISAVGINMLVVPELVRAPNTLVAAVMWDLMSL